MSEAFGLFIIIAGMYLFLREFWKRDVDLTFFRSAYDNASSNESLNGNGRPCE